MTRDATGFLPLAESRDETAPDRTGDRIARIAFGAIGWPWLLYSLWGGTRASKLALLSRIGLGEDALPNLGSWKADTGFLHRIVDAIETLRPQVVVELGAGASTLVCAQALAIHGGGRLVSYDQHAGFADATRAWLADHGLAAEVHHAPLETALPGWQGRWYALDDVPERIDLLVIDGPPWTVHPFIRGAAESLFPRLAPGGIVLLDDAARPGERVVARRWRRNWPDIAFRRLPGSTKGTLIGRKRGTAAVARPVAANDGAASGWTWRRAAAIALLFASGWLAHDVAGSLDAPVEAASFVDQASASHSASLVRQRMQSLPENARLDRSEIRRAIGIALPGLPANWQVADVQIYPSDSAVAVELALVTDRGEFISLFARRAETPAGQAPLLASRRSRSIAYWEEGPNAFAVTAELAPARVLALAALLAAD